MTEPTTVNKLDELLEHYGQVGEAWLVVIGGDSWPYLLTCTEDGEVFLQTFPSENEEGDAFAGKPLNTGTFLIEELPASFYPARVVAAG